jgi:hypothetical protein
MASIQQDSYAKSSICPINKTAVYIYRLGSSDRTLKTLITVDNKEIAHTVFASYLYLQLNPGSHEIIAHTEYWSYDKNTKRFGYISRPHSDLKLNIDMVSGKTYYIRQCDSNFDVWWKRVDLQIVDEIEGREGLKKCLLLDTPIATKD